MKASLVVVCHHSSGVLPLCVESFRAQVRTAGLEPEIVVVEQSEDESEAALVKQCRPDRLLIRPNRGYAAGLNAGVAEAAGELLLLANPDVELLDESVVALADAVAAGADVAGPQLLWDRRAEVLLPAPDDPGPGAELGRTIRQRWPGWRSLHRLVETNWRVWTATDPLEVPSLRGPLMAVRRESLQRLGPLDEGYFLYYEETDWLLRARRAGARLRLAPGARVVHRWGHSTELRADRAEVEAGSRARFFRRNYPAAVRALLGVLQRQQAESHRGFELVGDPQDLAADEPDVWLISIVGQMEPAVGCLGCSTLPESALELTSRGRWYAVAARRDYRRWRSIGSWTWERA